MESAPLLVKFFMLAFSALLPVINPLGSALIFLGLVGSVPEPALRSLARKTAITTTLFLLIVELAGALILKFFGISLPVVEVAGGLVLSSMGWGLLSQEDPSTDGRRTAAEEVDAKSFEQKIFYPLTFPVTAGPGCVVVMLTLSAHASTKNVFENVMSHLGVFLAVVALSVIVFLMYAYAPKITKRVSPFTANGILRIIAFVLLCIGVQITWNGVATLIKALR